MSQKSTKPKKEDMKMEIDQDSFNPNNPYEKIIIPYENEDEI
jgi:hypothetical protein